jgi:hypothetical protein
MSNIAYLEIRLSGGASNTDPEAAYAGGAMSTVAGGLVDSQSATALSTITGVTILDAAGNAPGVGTMVFDFSAKTLRFTPPGGTAGTPVDVSVNGDYAIQGGNNGGLLKVTVVAGSLPGSNQTNTTTIANLTENIFDDVAKTESRDGSVAVRGLFLKNAHGVDAMVDGKLWIENNTPGQDVVQIAMDTVAVDADATAVASEPDTAGALASASIDFDANNPVDAASGLTVPDLDAGEFQAFWIKRTVPAGVDASELNNTFRLGFQVSV